MKLLYFAWVRQKTGTAEEEFPLPAGVATVADLAGVLGARGQGYAEAFADRTRLRCAVNQIHSGFDTQISDTDEIAFFPPVTGG